MSAALGYLFSTSGVVTAFLLSAVWMWRRPQSSTARRFLIMVAVLYTLASVYEVPRTIGRILTLGYHPFAETDVPAGTSAVVVLGGGAQRVTGWNNSLTLLNEVGAARVLEAWRVFRLVDPAWIISSGGVADRTGRFEPDAITMRNALVRLGVPESRIKLESSSRDTHDEAVLVTPLLRSLNVQNLILVTSDIHMRRSLGAFRAEGWHPIPAIAPDYRRGVRAVDRWTPHLHGLSFSDELVHELAGIPYYWARGWWR